MIGHLSNAGTPLGEQALAEAKRRIKAGVQPSRKVLLAAADKPRWDHDNRELRWGEFLVERFRQQATAQIRILDAFQKQGWVQCIKSPLLARGKESAAARKQRLCNTLKNLNRKQRIKLLQFGGDGTGQGIIWQLITG